MSSYLPATSPHWMENMGKRRKSPWQNLSSFEFTSFSALITCQSLRGRRLSRALLEGPSTKHAKNVTRTNHSERLARQKLKDCIYKQKMNTHIYSLSSCFWFGFSALLILIKAFTKEVPLCSTSNQFGPF